LFATLSCVHQHLVQPGTGSDIFAFGAILYDMLTGRRAFHGETTMDTMVAIAKEPPSDLSGSDRTSS